MLHVKQKFLVCILIVSMLFPTIPVFSIVDGEWTEDIDVSPQYEIDTKYMNETGGSASASSGAADRWTKNQNATLKSVDDPMGANGNVTSYSSPVNVTGTLLKSLFHQSYPITESIILSQDFAIPSPDVENGVDTASLVIEMFGNQVFSLVYDESIGKFQGTYYDRSFTIGYDSWLRFHNVISTSSDKKTATVYSQLSFTSSSDQSMGVYMQTSAQLSVKSEYYTLKVRGKTDCKGLAYMDNTIVMSPGDFGEAKVTTQSLNDYYRNYDLSGQVKVALYHMMDMTTFDISKVRLCNKLSEEIPYTSLTLSYDAQTLIFDFSNNKLPKHEDVYICFGDEIRDFYNQPMYEPTIVLKTRGDYMELPPPADVIEVPAEGFVMPDLWNTGYRCDYSELVPLVEKYPEIVANGNVIDEKIARKYNYEFSHFTHTSHIYVIATSPVYIHDFYMNGGGFSNGKTGKNTSSSRVTIAWGEGEGSSGDYFGGHNLTISHCYIHDVGADHMKGTNGQVVEFNYFRDGGTRKPGAHADVVQFMGGSTAGMNAYFYGNRFDAPNLAYDHVANCCFFYKPEKTSVGYVNIQAIGNWLNGGGYTTYLTPACDKSLNQQIYYNDNQWGCGFTFGPMNYDGKWVTENNGTYKNNGYMTSLQTGSVVYYNGEANAANRVYAAEDLTAGKATVMVNFANYMEYVRGYRIEVNVLDQEGNVVTSATKIGIVRRYKPVDEYMVSSNLRDTGLTNPENGNKIYELIEMPDLPHDVPEYVELENIPLDMMNYTISVSVYDTTDGNQLIRTSNLGYEVSDCTRPRQNDDGEITHTVTFKDSDGSTLSIQAVKNGENAIPPEAPSKEGLEFVGWTGDYTNVQGNLTLTAIYQTVAAPVYFDVVFKDAEGNVLLTESVLKGTSANAPIPPDKSGYTFAGWSTSYSNVQSNLEIYALYEKIDTRSQELRAFSQALDVLEAAKQETFASRLAKIQAAYAKWLLVDETEEGAYEAYSCFEIFVLQYNKDVADINQTMQNGETISQTTTKCPISY